MKKWGREYWIDLGERVGASALGGVLTMITADASGVISGSAQQWWLIVGVPSATALVKGLLVNMSGSTPTASVVGVSSEH